MSSPTPPPPNKNKWQPKLFLFEFCAGCTDYQHQGTFFYDFVDISIFMILGSLGAPEQDWLDWQIWPSGRELSSQAQGPGSNSPSSLMGSLWDPTSVLVGSVSSGGYFSPKSPFWKWGIMDFLDVNEKYKNLIIIVDLAPYTWYNLCASRRHTLWGLFLPRSPFWKWEIIDFLDFYETSYLLIILV